MSGPGEVAGELRSAAFRRQRVGSWTELGRIVQKAEKRGIRGLGAEELARLPELYRAATTSLSVARSLFLDRALLLYLESLVARAHVLLHSPRRRILRGIAIHLTGRFPRLVLSTLPLHVLAAAMLCAGGVAGFLATQRDPEVFYTIVPEGIAQGRNPASTTEELWRTLHGGDRHGDDDLAAFSAMLFTHNSTVGILAFALGFLAGVPVLLLLFYNGLMLGAFSALFHSRDLAADWWGWILPHGVTELLAIVLCGGAGLMVTGALVFPGRHSRASNLSRAGRDAGGIALGCLVLFLLAGLLEGFFRQLVHSNQYRWLVAATTAILWLGYFAIAGRRSRGALEVGAVR